jgi:anaerobic dimethyl sulfoxide reductase subunit B (iron-sulfur subunit)
MTQYAFYFDSSACSGCKACQVACKDKHNLPLGILWRRVYEVTGGEWTRRGEAWLTTVFAYNISLACNHCEHPICVEVCPSGAMHQRADGIVLVDADKCLGCRYCSWACPYGAPQYDEQAGHMTKCTLCAEELDASLPPACVAACPLRALDCGERAELAAKYGALDAVYPLPPAELTGPSLILTPHQDAARAAREPACVGNWEEIGTR